MPEELIMRGKTNTGGQETLNFGGRTPGYGYQMVSFQLYPSAGLGTSDDSMIGSVTAADVAEDPENPNFDHPGLIATAEMRSSNNPAYPTTYNSVVNDLFIITQDLILLVAAPDGGNDINWQCRFKKVKLSASAEAVANFNQFTIYDG